MECATCQLLCLFQLRHAFPAMWISQLLVAAVTYRWYPRPISRLGLWDQNLSIIRFAKFIQVDPSPHLCKSLEPSISMFSLLSSLSFLYPYIIITIWCMDTDWYASIKGVSMFPVLCMSSSQITCHHHRWFRQATWSGRAVGVVGQGILRGGLPGQDLLTHRHIHSGFIEQYWGGSPTIPWWYISGLTKHHGDIFNWDNWDNWDNQAFFAVDQLIGSVLKHWGPHRREAMSAAQGITVSRHIAASTQVGGHVTCFTTGNATLGGPRCSNCPPNVDVGRFEICCSNLGGDPRFSGSGWHHRPKIFRFGWHHPAV